ncbi:MAG: hypothetical protein VX573_00265 [Bacteroidota bacterium]|nr:hypothetical protein [Bacteroidota bacterium]
MKKGLLTLLAASLVFVGCQNYDDQFDDLNAQISALKSQVDGLSSLSGQVASLSGTISGLQAGIAAAASSSELSALSTSLASLASDVDAVQASIASTASASAVSTLQAEIDAIEADLADLLSTSNIYSSNVSVTNATTLNAALALGNKINVLNADLTITGYSGMDYAKVQTLIDRINTMTGAITYTAAGSTGTEVVFNNLTSVGDITMTQPGGYHFPKLTNAGDIDLKDDYETTVTRVNFPLLTTVTALKTDATADTIEFTYATEVGLGSLVTAPGTSLTITTKKDATLDLGSWVAKDASGNYISFTLTLNGPASFTNGTAAGTFASTGLPAQTVGMHDGTISLTNVATAAVHNFRGAITLSTGVKNFTGNNVVTVDESAAVDLETYNVTYIRDNDPANSATVVAAFEKETNTAQDDSFSSSFTKLTSVTITGKGGDVTANAAPALTTVNLTGLQAFDVNMTGNTALVSYTDATSANDFTFTNNDVMTSLNASHTTALYGTDKAASVTITGNAEIATLTIGFDDVDALNITSNAKLATIAGGTNLKDNGTSTTTDVDIHQNALVASLVRDTKESPSATVVAGASSDTGSITTASGIKDLDAFLADALAASGTISVWFDTVTKLEIQSTYGGSYTDTTSSVTAPTAWDDTTAAANAVLRQSGTYAGVYAYLFNRDAAAGTTTTTGAISKEVQSRTWALKPNANTLVVPALGSGEGFSVTTGSGTYTFVQGASYTGAANGSTVASVTDLINYVNADTALNTADNVELIAAQDGYNRAAYTIAYTNSPGTSGAVEGVVSTAGNLYFTYGTDTGTGATNQLTAALLAGDSEADVADAIMTAINAHADYSAVTATGNANSNRFIVTRNVSGTGGANTSPEITSSSFPTIDISVGVATTTAVLTGTAYNGVISSAVLTAGSASSINARGTASGFFSIPDVSGTYLAGLRLTLRNDGNVALVGTTTAVIAGASNTAISANTGDPDGTDNLLVKGVNISTYVASTNEGPATYVAAFSDIASGTTTTTGAVTAVLTDRTGW